MDELHQLRVELLGSFLLFTKFMFKEKTGREFLISKPLAGNSHFIEICNTLEDVFYGKIRRLIINCPPGWSKSELVKSFICWATAWYPYSNHLYISYSHELASSHTYSIKQTMSLPIYKRLFDIEINRDSSAKDFFKNNQGGTIGAFGSAGTITGRDAGLPGISHYSGAVILDDMHKPDEVHSDVIREKVIRNFNETISQRCRSENVPIILIGQRLHEQDICGYLLNTETGEHWDKLIIKGLDEQGNSRYPEVISTERLKSMSKYQPYVYSSQYQQDPIPSGGGLFHEDDFTIHEYIPEIIATFITADTAETDKEWNDKTVFSFWGIYKIKYKNESFPDQYGLHWLDCNAISVEPKDLEPEFMDFWGRCMQFKIKPQAAYIEKKSTGTTLLSVLRKVQGLKTVAIERTIASGSKTQRFIDMQQYIAQKLISFTYGAKHNKMCIEHMTKITANDSHRYDDIADTCYDAINATFIDKSITYGIKTEDKNDFIDVYTKMNDRTIMLRKKAYGYSKLY